MDRKPHVDVSQVIDAAAIGRFHLRMLLMCGAALFFDVPSPPRERP